MAKASNKKTENLICNSTDSINTSGSTVPVSDETEAGGQNSSVLSVKASDKNTDAATDGEVNLTKEQPMELSNNLLTEQSSEPTNNLLTEQPAELIGNLSAKQISNLPAKQPRSPIKKTFRQRQTLIPVKSLSESVSPTLKMTAMFSFR